MMQQTSSGIGTHLVMLLNILLVSTSFPIGAAITHALEPAALNCLRFALAAAVFALLVTLQGEWRRPGLRDGLRYLLLAGSLVGFFVAMFEALRLTSAVNTSSLFTLVPLFSAAIAWPLVGQRTPPRQFAFMLLAGFGALWVVFKGSLANALALSFGQGDLIFVAGCVSLAAFSPLTRRLNVGENLLSQTFWTLLVGAVMLALIGADDLVTTDWQAVSTTAWSGHCLSGRVHDGSHVLLGQIRQPAAAVRQGDVLQLPDAALRRAAGGAPDWRHARADGPDRGRDFSAGNAISATFSDADNDMVDL